MEMTPGQAQLDGERVSDPCPAPSPPRGAELGSRASAASSPPHPSQLSGAADET